MPSTAPFSTNTTIAKLGALGNRIRTHRKALHVSAVTAAQAAGMSRVTLHRIEQGEASVTMGAYLNAMHALGLELDVVGAQKQHLGAMPLTIRVDDYPQLKQLAWHLPGTSEVTPQEALALYERNWRHIDRNAMTSAERALLEELTRTVGKGHLLV